MASEEQPPRRIAYDVFHLDGDVQRVLYSDVLCRGDGADVTALGYRTYGPGERPIASTFVNPAVVLHRRGRRIVGLRHCGCGSERAARDGLVSLFPAGWEVCPNYLEPCEGLIVGLSPRLLSATAGQLGVADGFPALAGLADDVLEGMCETLWRANGGTGQLADALGRAIATHVLQRYAPTKPAVPGWFRRAERHIDENLGGRLAVEEVASAAGMSRAHFSRLFKRVSGLSPHDFVLHRRVDRAKHLLHAEPNAPLSDVAAEAGFCDQSHLTGVFRKLVGVTPAAYRAKVRHEPPTE